MNTRRNTSKVLAQFLRAAIRDLRVADYWTSAGRTLHDRALASIDQVAEELEQLAASPDPANPSQETP